MSGRSRLGGAALIVSASIGVCAATISNPSQSRPRDEGVAGVPSAAISGAVVDQATSSPIPGALVELTLDRTSRAPIRQLTDPKGRFIFTDLPPSEHAVLRAAQRGYLDHGGSGRAGLGGYFTLTDGEWISDVRIVLHRAAAIAGSVVDERGEPMVGIFVRVLSKLRVFDHDELIVGPFTTTDDRGRYLMGNLSPGKYLVQVPSSQTSESEAWDEHQRGHFPTPPSDADGHARAYAATFAPRALDAESAQAVDVTFGDRIDVDISLSPVSAFRISGMVSGPQDASAHASARLVPRGAERLGYGSEVSRAAVDERGRFSFANVPAGSYSIEVSQRSGEFSLDMHSVVPRVFFSLMPGSPGASWRDVAIGPSGLQFKMIGNSTGRYWGHEPIVVDRSDLTGVVVTMREGGTLDGLVEKDILPNAPVPAADPSATLQLEPADGSPALGALRTAEAADAREGRFAIRGLLPGKYLLRTSGWDHFGWDNSGWLVKSISWNGRDYTDAPFDAAQTPDFHDVHVVVTNGGATLTGVVADASHATLGDAKVVIFPNRLDRWRSVGLWPSTIRSTSVSNRGRFEIPLVPAGDYLVAAIRRTVGDEGLSPELLATIRPLAAPISLTWGETKQVALTVAESRK